MSRDRRGDPAQEVIGSIPFSSTNSNRIVITVRGCGFEDEEDLEVRELGGAASRTSPAAARPATSNRTRVLGKSNAGKTNFANGVIHAPDRGRIHTARL